MVSNQPARGCYAMLLVQQQLYQGPRLAERLLAGMLQAKHVIHEYKSMRVSPSCSTGCKSMLLESKAPRDMMVHTPGWSRDSAALSLVSYHFCQPGF
jgi:hypothetical protein